MIALALALLLLGSGVVAGAVVWRARVLRDISACTAALAERSRNGRTRAPVLRTAPGRYLWDAFRASELQRPHEPQTKNEFARALALGSEALKTSGVRAAADKLTPLLQHETSSGVRCAGILYRTDKGIELLSISGVPRERIEQPLLSFADDLFDNRQGSAAWGLSPVPKESLYDFGWLDIRHTLAIPIRIGSETKGVLWVGLMSAFALSSEEQRSFLVALAQHCAITLATAETLESERGKEREERTRLLGLSHDTRSPSATALYAVREMRSQLRNMSADEQQVRLDIIEECLAEQLAILDDVFTYVDHQQGSPTSRVDTISLEELVTPCIQRHELAAITKGIRLGSEKIPDVKVVVDKKGIRRAINNVLSNAIKYSVGNAVELRFRTAPGLITLDVQDSGPGIPEGEQHLLFQEFSRLPQSAHIPGTGLGLAVARALVQSSGGTISVANAPESGAIFSLSLPTGAKTTPFGGAEGGQADAPGSILLVEDDPLVARTHLRFLADLPVHCHWARTIAESIQTLQEQKNIGLVIADWRLESATSEQLFNWLGVERPHLPVVLLTSVASPIFPSRAIPSTLQLRKPITRDQLISAARSFLYALPVNERAA